MTSLPARSALGGLMSRAHRRSEGRALVRLAGSGVCLRMLSRRAPELGDMAGVVAAIHHACATLTRLAEADHAQIVTAARAGRILVPTRSLPESFDIPYPFAPAPGARVEPLLCAYHDARTASSQVTADVGAVAAAVRAPSQVITTALPPSRPAEAAFRQRRDKTLPSRHLRSAQACTCLARSSASCLTWASPARPRSNAQQPSTRPESSSSSKPPRNQVPGA